MADSLYDTLDPERLRKPGYMSAFAPVPPEPGLAPKIDTGAAPPALAPFGQQMPKSSLGDQVPLGEPISPKQMPKAEGEFHQTDPLHGMLKSFGDRRSSLMSQMPHDVQDPNYLPQLIAHSAGMDAIKRDEAEFKKAHPWGSSDAETGVENHPGALGKIGHVLGTIGNVAGNVLAPNVMAQIPGSRANLNLQEAQGKAGVKEAVGEEASLQKAQAAETTAGAHKETADVGAVNTPKLTDIKQQAQDTKDTALPAQLGEAVRTGDHEKAQQILDMLKQEKAAAKPVGQQHVAGTVNGKPAFGDFHPDTGKFTDPVTQAEIPNFQPQPPQPQVGGLLVEPPAPGATGGHIVQAKPGMNIPAGTQNISGFAGLERPTTQMRNIDAQAQIASQGIPNVVSEVQRLGASLGPVAGRWNDFMQGRVGMDNPEFAGLRADLLMVSSAVALAHARGRLPENLREEFDHMINSPKQTPENLISVLNHVKPWMDRMSNMGPQNPFEQPTGTTPGAAPSTNAADPFGILGK